MKFNLILEDMELIKDNFEKFTSPLEDIDKKIRNKTQQNFQLGLVINKKDENDIKLGLDGSFSSDDKNKIENSFSIKLVKCDIVCVSFSFIGISLSMLDSDFLSYILATREDFSSSILCDKK